MNKKVMLLIGIGLLLVLVAYLIIDTKKPTDAREESPQKGFDLHVDAKHYVGDARVSVHHWCKTMSEKLIECLLFDSDNKDASLVGIETIVPNDVWSTFTEKQKREWHDHETEIIEAEATLPGTPEEEAVGIVEFLKKTHGRVIYIWNFPKEPYPTTEPFLDADKANINIQQ